VMNRPPRPKGEGVITRGMWTNICLAGVVMAVGTLAVLDASLPGGFIEGEGSMRYAQTMAFTTLMLFQMFNVFNSRSNDESAFRGLFHNPGLWLGLGVSILLQVLVVHLPFFQQAFSTSSLSAADWMRCTLVASSVLWVLELYKVWIRRQAHKTQPASATAASWPELRQT
jgi:Ca2+-transporting ATPase